MRPRPGKISEDTCCPPPLSRCCRHSSQGLRWTFPRFQRGSGNQNYSSHSQEGPSPPRTRCPALRCRLWSCCLCSSLTSLTTSWGCRRPTPTWSCWGWHLCCERRRRRQIRRDACLQTDAQTQSLPVGGACRTGRRRPLGCRGHAGRGGKTETLEKEKKKAKFDHVNSTLRASLLTFILSPEGTTTRVQHGSTSPPAPPASD